MRARAGVLAGIVFGGLAALWLLQRSASQPPELPDGHRAGTASVDAVSTPTPGLTGAPAPLIAGSPGPEVAPPVGRPGGAPGLARLTVRVSHGDRPLEGARVEVRELEPGEEEGKILEGTSGADGVCTLEVDALSYPLGVTARGGASLAPAFVVLDDLPVDGIDVVLEAGAPLEVRTVDLQGKPVPGLDVVVYPIDIGARGEAGPVRGPGGWFLEDGRQVTTDGSGVACVEGLDAGRLYRAYASGWSTPMQLLDSEGAAKPMHDAVRPGVGRVLQLMVAPLRLTWLRAVDAESGKPLGAATISPIKRVSEAGKFKNEWTLLRQAYAGLWYGREALLGLTQPVLHADYFREYIVVREGAPAEVACGGVRVEAPGHEPQELPVVARSLESATSGPVLVPLRRTEGASITPVTLRLTSQRPDIRTLVKLLQDRRSVYLRGFDAVLHRGQAFELQLVPGTYELLIGGNAVETLELRGQQHIALDVDLDQLPSVQVQLDVEGVPHVGIGSLFLAPQKQGPLHWMFGHSRVPYTAGLAPPVVVPAGPLVVTGGTGDGRTSGRELVEIAAGEHAVVNVRIE
ncbi:MAG: hypothetical protein AB7T63_07375 [Planctomycetota bacterium]